VRPAALLVGAGLIACAFPGGWSAAESPPADQPVAVACRAEPAQARLTLAPTRGVLLSAEYGVSVSASQHDETVWGLALPHVHGKGTGYFTAPVHLALPIRRAAARPHLHVEYGYCSDDGLCMIEDVDVACD